MAMGLKTTYGSLVSLLLGTQQGQWMYPHALLPDLWLNIDKSSLVQSQCRQPQLLFAMTTLCPEDNISISSPYLLFLYFFCSRFHNNCWALGRVVIQMSCLGLRIQPLLIHSTLSRLEISLTSIQCKERLLRWRLTAAFVYEYKNIFRKKSGVVSVCEITSSSLGSITFLAMTCVCLFIGFTVSGMCSRSWRRPQIQPESDWLPSITAMPLLYQCTHLGWSVSIVVCRVHNWARSFMLFSSNSLHSTVQHHKIYPPMRRLLS